MDDSVKGLLALLAIVLISFSPILYEVCLFLADSILKHLNQSWKWAMRMASKLLDELVTYSTWLWKCARIHLANLQTRFAKPVSLKLLVDKDRNRVLYAESDAKFIDILLSFLTLPIRTVVRLMGKKSGIGSMDALYKNVLALDEQYFRTQACKTMLLDPTSAYDIPCKNLPIKISKSDSSKQYVCSTKHCRTEEGFRLASAVKDSICICAKFMNKAVYLNYEDKTDDSTGVFMKAQDRFVVTDDLQVIPASVTNICLLLQQLGVTGRPILHEVEVKVGINEVLRLLNCSMISHSVLTDVFLSNDKDRENLLPFQSLSIQNSHQKQQHTTTRKMTIKLLRRGSTNRILGAEGQEDFIDLLFSFLTFPIGSIVRLLEGHSSMGSIDNLYQSARNLDTQNFIDSTRIHMILDPKLADKFGCRNQLLPIEEETPMQFNDYKCYTCFLRGKECSHMTFKRLAIMNPKLPGRISTGGGFFKQQGSLLVFDDLTIEPLSPVSTVYRLNKLGVPFNDVEVQSIEVGEDEALVLLKSSLISKNVLSYVFN